MHNERLTLATICGGAVQEKVDRALGKVVENILDPNTDSEKKRTITLKITMKPNEHDYEDVNVTADVSYTLAPDLGVQTQFFVNKDLQDGHVTVMEHRRGEIRGQLDFNDLEMIKNSQAGFLFRPPKHIQEEYKQIKTFTEYSDFLAAIKAVIEAE